MERILISFREDEYNRFVIGLREAAATASEFINQASKICRFDFPDNVIEDIFLGKGESTAAMLENKIKEELKTAGISSDTVVKMAVNGDLEKFYTVFNKKKNIDYEFLKYLKLDGKTVSIKEEELEGAKENYKSYITTATGKEIREKQIAMIGAINDFLKVAKVFNSTNFSNIIPIGFGNKAEVVELTYDQL